MMRNPQTGLLLHFTTQEDCERWRRDNAAAIANGEDTSCVEAEPGLFVIMIQETQRQALDLSCPAGEASGLFRPWEGRDYLFGEYSDDNLCDFVQVQLT